ncbi:WLM-domain-containing protein [Gymnopus androsaceus JB14]|uniref:WLM-domain-containing protein n=1 Tax=Gymnopus androsaceus JB14 TaxID=1447944 RepID=A0A6A4IG08_9AGAR|nr:WLM-domain-containing protein [Gymnopus androsaceus JB14]
MVHSRFNEKESNPNPFINWINPLPANDSEDARQYLRALAAQVRPIMKAHGFTVNSLEEYEYNTVFAGRNWEAGETIELVLRRPDGSFLPSSWLMSTFCHELAHIKHMNHGPGFQALWQKLREEVRELQNKGYYGDGYWSAGTRLADSAVVSGQGLDTGDLPEYICGGAQNRARPAKLRQRRGPRRVAPSNSTGRQTEKKRKAGSRVTSKYAFQGQGASLTGSDADMKGNGFGKQAGSKRAREERALAAERRLLQASSSTIPPPPLAEYSDSDEHPDDSDIIAETDADRRSTLLTAEQDQDLGNLSSGTSWRDFQNDFVFTGQGQSIDISSESEDESGSDVKAKGKRKASEQPKEPPVKVAKTTKNTDPKSTLVSSEIAFRKKEALGMAPVKGKGRTIGSAQAEDSKSKNGDSCWSCLVCTLENQPLHLACAACGTERSKLTNV